MHTKPRKQKNGFMYRAGKIFQEMGTRDNLFLWLHGKTFSNVFVLVAEGLLKPALRKLSYGKYISLCQILTLSFIGCDARVHVHNTRSR